MKKMFSLLVIVMCLLITSGCSRQEQKEEDFFNETDYPAAIMVNDVIYLKGGSPMSAEVDSRAVIGYTESYTDTFPEKNGETNFNRELDMPYAEVDGGVAVLYQNEWYLCTPKKLSKDDEDDLTEQEKMELDPMYMSE